MAQPRSTEQRIRDVVHRLRNEIDLWFASASPEGVPHMIPLTFLWYDGRILMATSETSVTVRNLSLRPRGRVALRDTRDVVLIDGWTTLIPVDQLNPGIRAAFAAETGWDPAADDGYCYIGFEPEWMAAWRDEDELTDRDVMRKGSWLG